MTALEQSAELGRKAANALHSKRDQSLSRHFSEYQSRFVNTAKPEDRKAVCCVECVNQGREESSYYIGGPSIAR